MSALKGDSFDVWVVDFVGAAEVELAVDFEGVAEEELEVDLEEVVEDELDVLLDLEEEEEELDELELEELFELDEPDEPELEELDDGGDGGADVLSETPMLMVQDGLQPADQFLEFEDHLAFVRFSGLHAPSRVQVVSSAPRPEGVAPEDA